MNTLDRRNFISWNLMSLATAVVSNSAFALPIKLWGPEQGNVTLLHVVCKFPEWVNDRDFTEHLQKLTDVGTIISLDDEMKRNGDLLEMRYHLEPTQAEWTYVFKNRECHRRWDKFRMQNCPIDSSYLESQFKYYSGLVDAPRAAVLDKPGKLNVASLGLKLASVDI